MQSRHIDLPSFVVIGKMVSGKGTFADAMRDALESEFHAAVYMAPSTSKIVAGVARDLFKAKDEADGKPNRTLMQQIGEAMAQIKPTVWAEYVIDDIKDKPLPFISEGLRRSEEVDAFRRAMPFPDLVVVRIEAEERQRQEMYKRVYGKYPTEEQLNHPTEVGIEHIQVDMTIKNNYSFVELRSQTREMIGAIKEGGLVELIRG